MPMSVSRGPGCIFQTSAWIKLRDNLHTPGVTALSSDMTMMRLCTISYEVPRWHLSGVDVQIAIDVQRSG